MIRYSTCTLQFEVDIDMSLVKEIWLTFSSDKYAGYEIFTKKLCDCEKTETGFEVTLSQHDTDELNKNNSCNKDIYIQARFLMIDGTSQVTEIAQTKICQVLKEGLME